MQNQKRYWLRGGVVALSLYALVSILLIPFGNIGNNECFVFCLPYWLAPSLIGGGLFALVLGDGFQFLVFAIPIVVYLIIGILTGWIYGKIKNRKS